MGSLNLYNRLVILSLLDLVSRDVPTGYFGSAGGFRMYFVLALCTTVSLKTLFQRFYRLDISSLLDLVSRDVPTGYFVSAGGFRMYFVLALCTTVSLNPT